jgi:hypothetical protein
MAKEVCERVANAPLLQREMDSHRMDWAILPLSTPQITSGPN